IEPSVIVLDGAHNPHAIRALRDDLRRYIQKYQITKKHLLFGVLHDKDYASMAQTLFSEFDEIVLVRPESPRALDPTALLRWGPRAQIASDVATAFDMAQAAHPELLCVTGSLYLVGAVKRLLL
ncbi:MAG: cyanophycin synthetase, partial [Candidatus Bipolaricaulota bacterium]|nr:cyanophycin synthetase [Candidatus Bipolaricaulota bacterium]